MNSRYGTGYYARYWTTNYGKVHVHDKQTGKPVCGSRISPEGKYQFCANGVQPMMVECGHCIEWLKKAQDAGVRKAWDRYMASQGLV